MNFRCDKYLEAFGAHMAKLRRDKNLSQTELANRAGITVSQVARIETGHLNPTICTVQVIAQALDIKITQFFPPHLPDISTDKTIHTIH